MVKSVLQLSEAMKKRTILLYAVVLAVLVFLLKVLEYRLWVRELSVTHYIGIIALLFTIVGVWAGLKLSRPRTVITQTAPPANLDELLAKKGISRREYEVLDLMARGMTNQEIADKLFISLNTVKTHAANLFLKLDAKRRTQAVERAKREGLIL